MELIFKSFQISNNVFVYMGYVGVYMFVCVYLPHPVMKNYV